MSSYIKVANVNDLPENGVKSVVIQGQAIALARLGQEIFAFENRCSHDDGPLAEGTLEDYEIECPRHGARFDVRTGEVLRMPAVTGIKAFPVKKEGSDILVLLE